MGYEKILYIDDDEDDQDIFCMAVTEIKGHTENCILSSDATASLAEIISGTLKPDVIFLDLNMPVMSGQQFLSELKNAPQSDIPVIILSTSSHHQIIKSVINMGAAAFITKPGSVKELVRLLTPYID